MGILLLSLMTSSNVRSLKAKHEIFWNSAELIMVNSLQWKVWSCVCVCVWISKGLPRGWRRGISIVLSRVFVSQLVKRTDSKKNEGKKRPTYISSDEGAAVVFARNLSKWFIFRGELSTKHIHAQTHANPQAPVHARTHTLYNSHQLLRFKTRFSSFVLAQWHLYGGHFVLLPTLYVMWYVIFSNPYSITWNILGHPVTHDFHQTDNIMINHMTALYVNFPCDP